MKLFAIALLALSTSVIAATPATVAVNSLLPEGNYKGSNCTVSVSNSTDSVVVLVKTKSESDSYGLSNKALGTNVDEQTGEVSASQSLNFPHYLQGGTKFLNIRALDNDTVAVSISKILLDHRGNDVSTYTECKVSL